MKNVQIRYPTNEDEQELWKNFKSGDAVAFERLLKIYYATLFRYASRFSKNRGLVEDCLQDVFLYLWEHREGLAQPPSVKFYLMKTVRNRMFLALKDKTEYFDDKEQPQPYSDDYAENKIIREETEQSLNQRLSQLVTSLPERQKEALFLRYYEQMKVEEIGEIMGVSRQSAANFLFRALSALRNKWVEKLVSALILVSLQHAS